MSPSQPAAKPGHGDSFPAAADIRGQLERIVNSPSFPASTLRRALLQFLIDETLAGRADRLKGFTIAVAVFGRDETFDAQTDPIVRLEARRLRRDLDGYYAGAGVDDPVRISIPKGAYVPSFERKAAAPGSGPPVAPAEASDAPTAAFAPPDKLRGAPSGHGARRRLLIALAVAAVIAAAVSGLLLTQRQYGRTAAARVAPQEQGATVIVLPFEALSLNDEDKFLAAGLTQQLVSNLMRFAGLRLYSVDGSSRQSPSADLLSLGQRLAIAYTVSGSLRSSGEGVRLSVSLVNAGSGQVLWSETYDRSLTPHNILDLEAELTASIATRLGAPYGIVRQVTTDQLANNTPQTMAAYACVLRAYTYRRSFAHELYAPVRACLTDAVQTDPGYADAWALLGWIHLDGARFGYVQAADTAREMDEALVSARHAVELAPLSPVGLQALSAITFYRGAYDDAEQIQRRALALNPHDPETLAQLGWRLAVRGRWDEGLGYLTQAIGRTVDPPPWYYFAFAMHDYINGDYAKAMVAAENAARDRYGFGLALVAMIQAALGDQQKAEHALSEMAARSPRLARDPAAYFRNAGGDEALIGRLVDGLHQAGWKPPSESLAVAE